MAPSLISRGTMGASWLPRFGGGSSRHSAVAFLEVVSFVAEDQTVEPRCGSFIHAGHDVLVGVGGEGVGVMPQALLDDLGVLAIGEEQRGVRVAQVMIVPMSAQP